MKISSVDWRRRLQGGAAVGATCLFVLRRAAQTFCFVPLTVMKDYPKDEGRVLGTFTSEAFEADVVEEPGVDCPVVAVRFIESDSGKPASVTFCSCHVREFRTLLSEVVEYLDQLDQG